MKLKEAARGAWEHKRELFSLLLISLCACQPRVEYSPVGTVLGKEYTPAHTLFLPEVKVGGGVGFKLHPVPDEWSVRMRVCPVRVTEDHPCKNVDFDTDKQHFDNAEVGGNMQVDSSFKPKGMEPYESFSPSN